MCGEYMANDQWRMSSANLAFPGKTKASVQRLHKDEF